MLTDEGDESHVEATELLGLQHRLFPGVGHSSAMGAAKAKNGTFHNILLVFAGWSLCWVSATIARFVYPPPKRWLERSDSPVH